MNCPSCGAPARPGAKFCRGCGAAFPARTCSRCGSPLSEDARFCAGCGGSTDVSTTIAASNGVCGNCGGPISTSAQFCANCGAPRDVTPAAPRPLPPPPSIRPNVSPPPPPIASFSGGAAAARRTQPARRGLPDGVVAILAILLLAAVGYASAMSAAPALSKQVAGLVGIKSGPATPAAGGASASLGGSGGKATPQPGGVLGGLLPAPPAAASPTRTVAVPTPTVVSLGAASVKQPEPAKVVKTQEWGDVPTNQVAVVLKDGQTRADADKLAQGIGGKVVGEVAYISLYQIETTGANEADLRAAIGKAKAGGADLAMPLQTVGNDAEPVVIMGERCSPLNDPLYQGENGVPYKMIGVESAWKYIKAAGVDLSDVHVGVVDGKLFKGTGEFDGKTKVDTGGPDDEAAAPEIGADGKPKPYSSHATGVTSIIGANGDNGGLTGIASPLGAKLHITVRNRNGGGGTTALPAADPKNPAQQTVDGQAWSIGPLAAIQKQIDGGAKVINMSFGNSNADPGWAAAYKRFFEKMAKDRPDVIFVASAGNDSNVQDGGKRFPSGLALDNMITVGALDNDGSRIGYSNQKSPNFEVTVGAPGHRVPFGLGADGRVENVNGGTSMSSPQVAATAALLKSLNPKLSAAEVKRIIAETGATSTDVSGKKVNVDASVGGKVLRVDLAVLRVINDLRKAKGLPPFDEKTLEKLAIVDASAEVKNPKSFTIKATIGATGEKGADVKIDVQGEGALGGSPTRHLDRAGDVSWTLDLLKEDNPPTVVVSRLDTQACSTITLATVDVAGRWEGVLVTRDGKAYADIPFTGPDGKDQTIKKEECEKSIKEGAGKPNKVVLTFTPENVTSGTVAFVTVDDEGKESTASKTPWRYTVYGDTVVVQAREQGGSFDYQAQVTLPPKNAPANEQVMKMAGNWAMSFTTKDGAKVLDMRGDITVQKPYAPTR